MTVNDIVHYRLNNQQLGKTIITNLSELVSGFCGIQAQDYESVKWSIGVRLSGATSQNIEKSIANREIIRTWLMRGTLHIAAADDIYWLLDLLAPRIIAANTFRNKQLELDDQTYKKCNCIIISALKENKQLTRRELENALNHVKINTDGQRLYHIIQNAALNKIICFGTKQGSEFTFVLLDGCVQSKKLMDRNEALAEITKRYLLNRSPATLHDFIWWSGLTSTDAKRGIESVSSLFDKHSVAGCEYMMQKNIPNHDRNLTTTFLLPAFDEYIIGYKDRSAILDIRQTKQVISKNGIFFPVIIDKGKVAGVWKRTLNKDRINIDLNTFTPFSITKMKKIIAAVNKFKLFTGKKLILTKINSKEF